jgi:membrane protease YdiL (CAAX protease family)
MAIVVIVEAVAVALHASGLHRANSDTLLPRDGSERTAWIVVAVSVGFCEELVYRGYLQTQLTAFTGSFRVAIFAQALLFGITHGERGGVAVAVAAVCGLVLGFLARARRRLHPGIVSHVAIDLLAGLAAR